MEYAESREYAQGDDARHIDWRLTARSGKPHTKLFQAERERLTLLVADTAPSLYFGTRTRFKSVQAARAGAVAAWIAVRDGDRIAALRGQRFFRLDFLAVNDQLARGHGLLRRHF